eukprot:gene8891-1825_t
MAGKKVTTLLRQGLGNLGHDVGSQVLLPAVIARLARCSPSDKQQLRMFVGNLSHPAPYVIPPLALNMISFKHTLLSEAWEDPAASDDYIAGALHELHFALDLSTGAPPGSWPAADIAAWPRYKPPADRTTYANYSGPLLLMHGMLDPDCSVGWAEHAR